MNSYTSIDPVKTGNFIAELRRAHNLTQEELGDLLFISRKSVSKWETGRCCPSIDLVKKLSDVLGVSIEDIIAGEFLNPSEADEVIRKVNYTEHGRKSNAFTCMSVSLILLILLIFNYSETVIYSFDYECEDFTISNGTILMSRDDSYFDFGNFYPGFSDANENTDYKFSLYLKENEEENILVEVDNLDTVITSRDILNVIADSLVKKDKDNLYMKISYTSIKDEPKTYDFKLNLTLLKQREILGTTKKNELAEPLLEKRPDIEDSTEAYSESEEENEDIVEVDLSFIFTTPIDKIKKIYHNKKIEVDGKKFTITYDSKLKALLISHTSEYFFIYLESKRIKDSQYFTFRPSDDYMFRLHNNTALYNLIKALKKVYDSNIK